MRDVAAPSRASSRLVRETLLACAQHRAGTRTAPAGLSRLSDSQLEQLLEEASVHRVLGIVHSQALPGLPAPITERLETYRRLRLAHHMLATLELNKLGRLLDEVGAPWLTFKGPVLSESLWPRTAERAYGDIDVLVAPRHLTAVVDVLEKNGARLVGDDWPELERTRRAQLNLVLPSGQVLDLHWALFNNPGVREAFPVDVDGVLARRRSVTLAGSSVPTLASADTLIHLAAHMSQSGAHLMVWVLDLHFAAVADGLSWPDVVARAHEWRLGLVTATMLARCRHLVGTPVPDEVLNQLTGARSWRRAVGALDRARPPHRTAGGVGTGRLLITSTRADTRTSIRQLARATAVEAVLPALRNPDHPWRRRILGRQSQSSGAVEVRELTAGPARDSFMRYVAEASA